MLTKEQINLIADNEISRMEAALNARNVKQWSRKEHHRRATINILTEAERLCTQSGFEIRKIS